MSDVALHTRGHGAWRRAVNGSRQFVLGMAEVFAAARRYRSLLMLSDAELSHLGLTRQDLPWFAVHGKVPR